MLSLNILRGARFIYSSSFDYLVDVLARVGYLRPLRLVVKRRVGYLRPLRLVLRHGREGEAKDSA